MRVVFCIATALVSLTASGAWAQNQNRNPPAAPKPLPEMTLEGTFQGAFPGGKIGVNDETDHPYWVFLTPHTKLSIAGTAKPDYLRGGMLVTFTADIDKKGIVTDPLTDLAIVVPSDAAKPGLFNEDRENKESTRFSVRGAVKSYKEGKLVVSAGGKQIQATVPEDAEIKFESLDLSLVQTGDAVTVVGGRIKNFNGAGALPQPGELRGDKIDIKLAEQLTAASHIKKKTAPKPAKPAPKAAGEGK